MNPYVAVSFSVAFGLKTGLVSSVQTEVKDVIWVVKEMADGRTEVRSWVLHTSVPCPLSRNTGGASHGTVPGPAEKQSFPLHQSSQSVTSHQQCKISFWEHRDIGLCPRSLQRN